MSQLPSGWARTRLADVALTQLGRMLSARRETGAHARPYLRNRDVQWGHINVTDLPTMDFRPEDGSRYRLAPGDLLVCEGGEVGRAAVWKGQLAECYYQKALHRVRTSEALSSAYLRYLLEHYARTKAFAPLTSGSTIAHLPQEDLRNLPVNLPPREEQDRIVIAVETEFSRIDAGAAALERVRHNLGRMRAAVLHAAITFLPGKAESLNLGDVLREPLRNGHSAKADPNGTIPIFSLTAVTQGDFSERNVKMTAADPDRVAGLWVEPGDLLIERSNTRELVGTARLYRGSSGVAVFPDLVIRARVGDRLLPEYAELALQAPSSRRYFQQCAQGISGTMPKIDQAVIAQLVLPVPPIEVQSWVISEAARQLSLIDAMESALAATERHREALRSSILRDAFAGRLAPQHRQDEPAWLLLERVAAKRAPANGHRPTTKRTPRTKVTA